MKQLKYLLTVILIIFSVSFTVYFGYRLAFRNLIFPRVMVSGIEVTGMDKDSAEKLIKTYFSTNPTSLTLTLNGNTVANLDSLVVERDYSWAAQQAMNVGRNGNLLTQIKEQFETLVKNRNLLVPINFDKTELADLTGQLASDYNTDPVWPKIVKEKGLFKLVAGKNGVIIKTDDLIAEISTKLAYPGKQVVEIPTTVVGTAANESLVSEAIKAITEWGDKRLVIKFRDYERKLTQEEMMSLFGLINDKVDKNSFAKLVNEIKPKTETEPSDAVFVFENNKVQEFKPEVIGAQLDLPAFETKISESLLSIKDVLEVPMILTYPKIKTGDINNLGIKELIGSGKSAFAHSIPGRVFNVNLAASRVNGTLVPPGEEFSFNKTVGEISKATGYQTAYIISQGRTVLGDGGGVCQVSTTTFRAALDAGLPITERKAHAYRVGYYEQDSPPGIDATVFYPTADLKFLNDTGHYILIQETVDTKNLTMKVDIYGTSDGREATISKPRISNQTPPPATMYVDDPTLAKGVLKQIDWSAWGANTAFDYKVERGGEIIYEKTFVSKYQPWRAIYLRGTME